MKKTNPNIEELKSFQFIHDKLSEYERHKYFDEAVKAKRKEYEKDKR